MTGGALHLRGHELRWQPAHPLVMGIVNTGADSFSDAGPPPTTASSVELALSLVADGADLIDVGGESGVTYNDESDAAAERDRVVPVIAELAAGGVAVSVDTYKPLVAEAALEAGAVLVNDVSGLRDPTLAALAAEAGAGLVVMHTRAAPKTVADPGYDDVVEDVLAFLAERRALALEQGVDPRGLLLDPGPDFAKTPAETIACLRAAGRLGELGSPWLAAVSRKYFQAAIVARPPRERAAMSLAAVAHVADLGAAIVRVHDVRDTADFLAARDVLAGRAEPNVVDGDDERLKWVRATERSRSEGRPRRDVS